MIKKNSWIVALILALSLTVFFGCVDGFVPEADEDTYTEFELKEFNTKGGNPYQEGWANDGSVWGDPDHTAKAIGLDLETLQKARYLEFDLEVDSLAGAMDVILGGDSKGWNQTNNVLAGGASGTQKIDLTLLNGYSDFVNATEKARIVIQYNQAGQGNAGVVKNPRLLISDKKPDVEIIPPPPPPCTNPECRDDACHKNDDCTNKLDKIYTIPSGENATTIILNLNDWKTVGVDTINANLPEGTLAATKITLGFTEASQRVVFKLTDEQVAKVLNSGKARVEIAGTTVSGTGTFRFHLGDPRAAGSWNGTDTLSNQAQPFTVVDPTLKETDPSKIPADGSGAITSDTAVAGAFNNPNLIKRDLSYSGNFKPDTASYLIIQQTNAVSSVIDITSIKITLSPVTSLAAVDITMSLPVAGLAAAKSVDGTGYTGVVTWTPTIDADTEKYATSTIYRANIVLSAKPGYSIPYNPADITVKVNGAVALYNSATRTVTTGFFPKTAGKPAELPLGVVFDLSKYLETATDVVAPLQKAASGSAAFVVDSTGITVSGRAASWNGIDIKLEDVPPTGAYPQDNKIKLTVTGNVVGTPGTGMRINIQGSDISYNWLATTPETGDGALTTANQEFTLTVNEIPADFIVKNVKIRICTTGSDLTSFKITSIKLENTGKR